MDKPRRVLCFGETLWDQLPGGAVPGGAPMNVALQLHRAGVAADLLSRVGDDVAGRALEQFIASRGLSTVYLQRDADFPTGSVDVDLSDPAAARYRIQRPVAWDFIDAEQFLQAGAAVDVLVYGSLAAREAVSRTSLQRLLPLASLRVFDVNLRPPLLSRAACEFLFEAADWIKMNEEELQWAGATFRIPGGRDACAQGLRRLFRIDTLCLTRGADGAVLYREEGIYAQRGFSVPVVDTVGCGDAFLGALLAGCLRGITLPQALRRATAVAALVAGRAGGAPLIPEPEITALIAG